MRGRGYLAGGSTASPASGGPVSGLVFPSNNVANADIRLVWDGSNLLPRESHTAIWNVKHVAQLGYFATAWHTSNDGTWHGSTYEYGTHPYPTDGSVDSSGQSTGGTGGSGSVQYFEISGLGSSDFIASPGPGTTTQLVAGVWYTQARTCTVSGSDRIHRFYPDVVNAPGVYIQQTITGTLATPTSPAFMFGSSPWTVSGNTNSECLSGTLRNLALFNAALSISDIAAEAAAPGNSAVTSAGQAAVWYINKNPTPSDVTDKSGQGRNPTWANANRPTLWTG